MGSGVRLVALLAAALVAGAAAAQPPAEPAPTPTRAPAAAVPLRPDRGKARACWSKLVTVDPVQGVGAELGQRAVARLLGTAHGVWLVSELCSALSDLGDGDREASRVHLHFVASQPECSSDGLGCFLPTTPRAEAYQVFVRLQRAGSNPGSQVYGEYPGNPGCTVLILYQQPESWMADSLYHELLHVWFLNAHAGEQRPYPTGHGNASKCQFDPDFLKLLDAFARELAAQEGHAPERLLPLPGTQGARGH
jgi:hypothetical protein